MDVIGKDILGMLIILACMVIIAYLKVRPFKEKKSKEVKLEKAKKTLPHGIEPWTYRLTADRSAD